MKLDREKLLELAALENAMADWLYKYSEDHPKVVSTFDAAMVCQNRAAALRALAGETK